MERRPKLAAAESLRAARMGAVLTLDEIAAMSGVSRSTMRRRLRALPARGPCAALTVPGVNVRSMPAAVAKMRPPPAQRLAADSRVSQVAATARGSAGWSRPLPQRPGGRVSGRIVALHVKLLEHLPAARLRRLVASAPAIAPIGEVSWKAACVHTEAAPVAVLRAVHASGVDASAAALRNTACPLDTLAAGSVSPWEHERAAVAGNISCPAVLYEQLVADPATIVQLAAAANPAPGPSIAVLVNSALPEIVEAVAQNPGCPPDVLDALAGDSRWWSYVAANPSTSPQTLASLPSAPDTAAMQAVGVLR